jgi:hypothetical protein
MDASSGATPAQRGREASANGASPVVLYHGPGATITTAYFESGGYRYPLTEFDGIERVENGGWLQSRRYELWAWYHNRQLRLFHCYDQQEFGQVCRALTRAREHAGLA